MRFGSTVFILCLGTTAALADGAVTCPDLGLENDYLSRLFCEQAMGITAQTGDSRSSWPDGLQPPDDKTDQPWRKLELLDEAYRVDPKKTLDLIERIKNAGGLIEE